MKITYLGHACFKIQGRDVQVVTDPFRGVGLPEPRAEADLVLCSHGHDDHSYVGQTAKPDARILVGFVGETEYAGVPVRGIKSFHDEAGGSKRGTNSIYVFKVDDMSLCHLGDLGHELPQDTMSAIGRVDVLFVPVGGFFTIGPREASRVVDQISPRVAIPMHFRTPRHSRMFDVLSTVDDFLSLRDRVRRTESSEVEFDPESLPEPTEIVVLQS